MFDSINLSHIFVFDQEKALDFYVGKLGLEVSADMNLGFMRWLTVRVPGEEDRVAGPRNDQQRRQRLCARPDDLRLPQDVRDIEGERSRVQRGADRAPL